MLFDGLLLLSLWQNEQTSFSQLAQLTAESVGCLHTRPQCRDGDSSAPILKLQMRARRKEITQPETKNSACSSVNERKGTQGIQWHSFPGKGTLTQIS